MDQITEEERETRAERGRQVVRFLTSEFNIAVLYQEVQGFPHILMELSQAEDMVAQLTARK